MALYSGSIYNNNNQNFNIIQYFNLEKINDYYTRYNINSYISAPIYSPNILSFSSSVINVFNQNQTVSLENVNGQLIISGSTSLTVYYQRVFSSGLNNWSYYKTIGYIDSNPSSIDTIPPYSGSILSHEIVGILKQ